MRSPARAYPDSLRVQRDPTTVRYRNFGGVRPPELGQILKWSFLLGPKETPAVERSRVRPEQFRTLAVGETVAFG